MATANGVGYITEYNYDSFSNLTWVKDPIGDVAIVEYDMLHRLKESTSSKIIKSEWTYDDLDRIQSVMHRDAQGKVLL